MSNSFTGRRLTTQPTPHNPPSVHGPQQKHSRDLVRSQTIAVYSGSFGRRTYPGKQHLKQSYRSMNQETGTVGKKSIPGRPRTSKRIRLFQ
ncbi:hypothetical protein J6590_089777, partial [Homalodisca vitripennis]